MSAPAALERGLHALQLLAQHPEGRSFSQIAEQLDLSNASAMRLLQALQSLKYIQKLPDQRGYRSSPKVAQLSGPHHLRQRFGEAARCFLDSLMERTGNTAISVFWTGQHMVCLNRVMHEDASPLQEPGHVVHTLHVAPWGWLFKALSWWEQQDAAAIESNQKGYSLQKDYILENLRSLDERGFTYLPGPERRRLAAPVYSEGKIIGALCLGGNIFTMPDEEIYHYGNLLARSAMACSDIV